MTESYKVRYEFTHDALRQEIERYRKLHHEYAVLSDELAVLNQDKQALQSEVRETSKQRDDALSQLHAARNATVDLHASQTRPLTARRITAAALAITLAMAVALALGYAYSRPTPEELAPDPDTPVEQAAFLPPPLTDMPCNPGKFVVWLAADKSPEALPNLGKQYELLNARSVGGGADPTLINATQGSKVCPKALANYSSPSAERFHLWAGPFETRQTALDWCHQIRLVGPDDACLARPTA